MDKLINAEFYRVRKVYNLLLWTIAFCILMSYVAYMNIVSNDTCVTGDLALSMYFETALIVVSYIPLFIGGMYCISYENKTLHYEVMCGNKIKNILFSKIIATMPILTFIMIAMSAVILAIFGCQNGFGNVRYIITRLGLFGIVCVGVVTNAILIMTTFKKAIGVFFIFLRFMVIEMVAMVITEVITDNAELIDKLNATTIQGKVAGLAAFDLKNSFIVILLISTVVEMVIWYMLSYITYKKKLFN